jgi:protease I
MRTALVVVAQEGYQDHELEGTVQGLSGAGFEITFCSKEVGPCTGKFGSVENATVSIQSADVLQYDRVGFIGGPGAAALADDPNAHALARATTDAGKPLGAICIAPTILAKAGLLKGKKSDCVE